MLQWTSALAEVPLAVIALARRFADQAGLALEYSERRMAEAAATRSSEETRRLLDVTTSMAADMPPLAVAETALREAFRGLGAVAGVVVRRLGEDELELVAELGYPEHTFAGWGRFDLEAELPLAEAVRRATIIALESRAERARRFPGTARRETPYEASLSLPLLAGGAVVGGMGLSFPAARTFGDGDREYAISLSRQSGQALERATLLETEHGARMRAERMASDVAQLHALTTTLGRATSATEVTDVVIDQIVDGIRADWAGLVTVDDRGQLAILGCSSREGHPSVEEFLAIVEACREPLSDALHAAVPIWLADQADWDDYAAIDAPYGRDRGPLGIVPLIVEQRPAGALLIRSAVDEPPTEEDRKFAETVARQAAQPLERVRLLESERASRIRVERANQQILRLQVVTESLTGALTASQVAHVMVNEGRAVLAGDGALAHVHDPVNDELTLLAAAGVPQDTTSVAHVLPTADTSPIGQAFHGSAQVEVRAGEAEQLGLVGPGAPFVQAICVPLQAGGNVTGVLTVGFTSPRELGDEEHRAALILGRQCAQALERSRLYDEEQVARRRADQLQELTAALSGALSPEDVTDVFVRHAAPAVGALGVGVGLLDPEPTGPHRLGWRTSDLSLPASWLEGGETATPIAHVLEAGSAEYLDASALETSYPDTAVWDGQFESVAFLPLTAGRRILGVGVLAWATQAGRSSAERSFIEAIASQCGQALDRALRYETERSIAETLQRSVLPETLPSMEGATVAARYLPGTAAIDVGGDWFDTLALADGRLGFVVGDVVGKGVQAASTMAQLRNGMRALTLDSSDAARIVTKLNRLLETYTDAPFATLAFLVVDPVTHEAELLSAGHLPPLIVSPDARPRFFEGARGLPLGVDPDAVYAAERMTLEPGAVIVLYTDGLVERRDRPLDDGLDLLLEASRDGGDDPERLVDSILASLIGDGVRGDDIAVLAVALDEAPLGTFELRLPADRDSLVVLRQSFDRWLERGAISEPDRRDLLLATWEASANAIEHAQDPSVPMVLVEARLTGDRVRVEVSDTGQWREPRDRPDRGLGLHLIQSLMTQTTVQPTGDGTTVVMERALTRERAGEGGSNGTDHRRA